MLWEKLVLEKDDDPLVKKMKGLSVLVAIVLSLLLAEHGTSNEVVLTALPQGQHFYLGEPIDLTCRVKNNSSEVWIYSWFRHNVSTAATPGAAHRINHHTYSISALTSEDSGMYWCAARKQDTNSTLWSNPVTISVTKENTFIAAWVWVVCAVIIILLLIPITILLVPCLRRRVKFLPTCGDFIRHQEMPRTKQDVTEIQWDLAWMEMSNLLDKPSPGS
ncbi:uncharacterized protein Hap1MRO34_007817 isoform 1-T1 [Clarias gariepinus]